MAQVPGAPAEIHYFVETVPIEGTDLNGLLNDRWNRNWQLFNMFTTTAGTGTKAVTSITLVWEPRAVRR